MAEPTPWFLGEKNLCEAWKKRIGEGCNEETGEKDTTKVEFRHNLPPGMICSYLKYLLTQVNNKLKDKTVSLLLILYADILSALKLPAIFRDKLIMELRCYN